MNTSENIVNLFSALLTPTIGIITAYIAVQQHRLEKLKSRREIYERRLSVYKAAMGFVGQIFRNGQPSMEDITTFSRETAEKFFLFNEDVQQFLDTIYKNAIELMALTAELTDSRLGVGEKRSGLVQKKSDLLGWFTKCPKDIIEKFGAYLKIGN